MNLLYRASSVEVEHDLSICRPDVALLDKDGKVVIAFEVVVTHAPEERVVLYYREHGIVLVIVNLGRDESYNFNDIGSIIAGRAQVAFCCNRTCDNYLPKAIKRRLKLAKDICQKCGRPIRRALVNLDTPLGIIENLDLSNEELVKTEQVFTSHHVPCRMFRSFNSIVSA